MIQDIAPHHFANEYRPQAPDKNSYILYYERKEVLIGRDDDGEIKFPTIGELEPYNEDLYENYTYLFSIDKDRYYLIENVEYDHLGYQMENTEVFRNEEVLYKCLAGVTGWQLYRWYRDHKFCGRCGKRLIEDDKERMLKCEHCKNQEYPKIMPAVIIGVTHGNRILMSKYADRDFKKYALLAGFVEIGESVEECVRREVMEEVGLRVKNIQYYKSQPWSFTDTLLMGYYAELDGGEEVTLDEEELAMAGWFERDSIPVKEHNLSLTNEMIMAFRNGRV